MKTATKKALETITDSLGGSSKVQEALEVIVNAVEINDTEAGKVFALDFHESMESEAGYTVTRVSRGFIYENSKGSIAFVPYGTGFDPYKD